MPLEGISMTSEPVSWGATEDLDPPRSGELSHINQLLHSTLKPPRSGELSHTQTQIIFSVVFPPVRGKPVLKPYRY
jgi:hypothetical protein